MHPVSPFVVITGITKGIGLAIAERFAREGFGLIGCSRHQNDLDLLGERLRQQYPDQMFHLMCADLGQPDEVADFGRFVLDCAPNPRILVNNAGIFNPGTILEEAEGMLERTMQINVFSAYHLTRHLVPAMIAVRKGHIFNLCSVASLQAYPGGSTYAITKFALLGFSRSLRAELKDTGLRVTSLLPGATWSDSWTGVDLAADRLMQADDLAELVWTSFSLKSPAVVEELIIRPQLGDL